MAKTGKYQSTASHPGNLTLSRSKLRRLQPDLFGWRSWFFSMKYANKKVGAAGMIEVLEDHLQSGDSRAAIVAMTQPALLIAAYSDEPDAVLIHMYPKFLIDEYGLKQGTKLLTINTYYSGTGLIVNLRGELTHLRAHRFDPPAGRK